MPFSLLEVKPGHGRSGHWNILKVGNKNNDEIVPPEKTKKRRLGSNTRQEPALWPGIYGSR